jgi:hypothetical protein
MYQYVAIVFIIILISCNSSPQKKPFAIQETKPADSIAVKDVAYDTTITTIHLFVALCDNKYQGIVPVPDAIGNGQDPDNNLYWGCGFGVRTYFKNSSQWTLVNKYPVDSLVMERIVFKHKTKNTYLIADAYNGQYIQQCTVDFLKSCSGQLKDTVISNGSTIGTNGNAKLIAYIGHNGLMDFTLSGSFKNTDNIKRDAIILACISRNYFSPILLDTKANPLIWTTGLMCPEAYTLHDAIESYLNQEPVANTRNAAAAAYSKYQKCGVKAAKNLLVTGW